MMKQPVIIAVLLLFLTSAVSEGQKVDISSRINLLSQISPEAANDSVLSILIQISSSNDSSSSQYFNRIHKFSQYINEPVISVSILNKLSVYDPDHYLEYLHEAIYISRKFNLKTDLFWALNTVAYYYKSSNQLDSAMTYVLRARDLVDHGDINGEVSTKLLLADLFYWARLYDKAEQIYKDVLKLKGDSSQFRTWIFSATNNNLGMIELNRRAYNRARDYFNTSLRFNIGKASDLNDSIAIAFSYYLLAKTEFEDNDIVRSREYYNMGIPVMKRNQSREFKLYYTLMNARLLFAEGETNQAYGQVWNAYNLISETAKGLQGTLESKPQLAADLLHIYELFINIHSDKEDSDSALYYFNLYRELEYTLDMNTANSAYIQMLAEKDYEVVSNKLMKSNEQRKFILGGFTIVFIFLIIMIYYTRRIMKIKKTLSDKQNELIKSNINLLNTSEELQRSTVAKDKFFSVLAHDLKNPFFSLKGFNELLEESLKLKDYETSVKYADIIRSSTDTIYDLLINLLEWSRIHTGNISFSPEPVLLKSLFSETIAKQEFQLRFKNILIESFAGEDSVLTCDKNMMLSILRNILSNAIKSTPENGKITITYSLTENFHSISIKDSGCGMSPERIDQVFGKKITSVESGESKNGGSGLGIIIVQDFLNYHKGVLKVNSQPGKGTEILLLLPGR